ncbi:hypothetical protein [Idiomarina sp. 017G]|uniref:Uncharacterized protein n=1 Tax=Idiomarina loihiensis (strain ATCC BAA-735 / DSM 15497 / L2-TR) TaxID=283942 RepID=Q5QZ98_IDILO|nr:hypothetical protein [Idiomarina sp. 017G]AAV81063.1 Hypothetical protein IL0220 [Idiomarina loihiensis L2TR]
MEFVSGINRRFHSTGKLGASCVRYWCQNVASFAANQYTTKHNGKAQPLSG